MIKSKSITLRVRFLLPILILLNACVKYQLRSRPFNGISSTTVRHNLSNSKALAILTTSTKLVYNLTMIHAAITYGIGRFTYLYPL